MRVPRWMNFFAETELHEWRVRLAQCLFVYVVTGVVVYVAIRLTA